MLKSVDSPLYHVFEQIVSEERRLPAVDSLSYEDERGLMGWVHGKRVLVGNRNLLETTALRRQTVRWSWSTPKTAAK